MKAWSDDQTDIENEDLRKAADREFQSDLDAGIAAGRDLVTFCQPQGVE